jgi:hypothetical protein
MPSSDQQLGDRAAKDFGKVVRQIRESKPRMPTYKSGGPRVKHMTQEQLGESFSRVWANKTGVERYFDDSWVRKLEDGDIRRVTPDFIEWIAEAMEADTDEKALLLKAAGYDECMLVLIVDSFGLEVAVADCNDEMYELCQDIASGILPLSDAKARMRLIRKSIARELVRRIPEMDW